MQRERTDSSNAIPGSPTEQRCRKLGIPYAHTTAKENAAQKKKKKKRNIKEKTQKNYQSLKKKYQRLHLQLMMKISM